MYLGSYFQNLFGQNEKWLGGSGGQLYFLLPDGELRKYAGSMSASMSAANLIATLDPADYANPQLLWSPVQPTFLVSGNQLTIGYPKGFTGSFVVQVTVNDAGTITTQNITVTVATTTTGSSLAGSASDVDAVAEPVPAADPTGPAAVTVAQSAAVNSQPASSFLTQTDFSQPANDVSSSSASTNGWQDDAVTPSAHYADVDLAADVDFAAIAVGEWLADNPI